MFFKSFQNKTNILLILLIFSFACQDSKKDIEKIVKNNKEDKVEFDYDFSTISKDTIIVSGKEILFFVPSKEEFEIIKNYDHNIKKDSLYKNIISRVERFLKFPKDIKISVSEKRIIGVQEGSRMRYYDRLDDFKTNYGMLMMYNQTFNFVKGFKTEKELYSKIDNYYRGNFRLERTIDYKYVIARNGLNVRDGNSQVVGKFDYGDLVKLVGYTKDSIEVIDNDKVLKDVNVIIKWKENGKTEKRFVFNGFLGEKRDIKVFEDQLCYGYYLKNHNLYSNNYNSQFQCLSEHVGLELISKKHYESLKTIHNTFLKENSLVIISENEDQTHNISLPLKDSTLVFKSKMDYSASSHEYIGDIDFLNQYLLNHVYYKAEEAFFTYINRDTGEKTYMFSGLPIISPKKDYIISFYYDIYEERFFIQRYKLDNTKIEFQKSYEFFFWLKTDLNEIKWISNNEFAIEITNKKLWNGSQDYNPQYLKIKFKD